MWQYNNQSCDFDINDFHKFHNTDRDEDAAKDEVRHFVTKGWRLLGKRATYLESQQNLHWKMLDMTRMTEMMRIGS